MANEQNLKPIRSKSRARELQKKSAQARTRNAEARKDLKKIIDLLFEKEYTSKDGTKVTGAEAIAMKQMEKAMKGDTKAFEVLRDTAGQKPVERVMVAEIEEDVIAEVEKAVMENDEETSG